MRILLYYCFRLEMGGTTVLPQYHFDGTEEFMVLLGTAISQIPRFCCSILAHNTSIV